MCKGIVCQSEKNFPVGKNEKILHLIDGDEHEQSVIYWIFAVDGENTTARGSNIGQLISRGETPA